MPFMPPMHVITYTDDDGTEHTGEFEFYDSALIVSEIANNGEYIGQCVWPRQTA